LEQQRKVRAEVKLPLILIHTPFGLDFFDRVAKWPGAKAWANINAYFMPLITALAIFLIVGSLAVLISNAGAREGVSNLGPQANLLIPGLNPYLPITYGWVALVVTIIIHEAGHGILARVYNIRVDSTGIVLLLGLPIGAFVNIERDELAKATLKQKSAVLTAGPLNNMILAGLSLLALFAIMSTLTPIPDPNAPQFGALVVSVNPGSLAESIGLSQGSVIQTVAGQEMRTLENLSDALRGNLGQTVDIAWIEQSGQSVTKSVALPAAVEPGRGILGIGVSTLSADPGDVLERYKGAFGSNPLAILLPPTIQQGSVPYSDLMAPKYESSIGPSWAIIANMLFWLWFVNFNVGIFNALPIGPLDGGQLYGSLLEKKIKSAVMAKHAANLLTIAMVAIVAASILLPYVR